MLLSWETTTSTVLRLLHASSFFLAPLSRHQIHGTDWTAESKNFVPSLVFDRNNSPMVVADPDLCFLALILLLYGGGTLTCLRTDWNGERRFVKHQRKEGSRRSTAAVVAAAAQKETRSSQGWASTRRIYHAC